MFSNESSGKEKEGRTIVIIISPKRKNMHAETLLSRSGQDICLPVGSSA